MKIAGIIKASFIDYPNKASTVIFIGGCNFRCGYCHNPEIVYDHYGDISIQDVFVFLEKRKKFLDGVCISGGEPTIHKGLISFIEEIKKLGYDIKLDTNGTNPEMIKMLIANKLLDYIAMDIKAPYDKYDIIADCKTDIAAVKESVALIKNAGIDYEFRTTICRELTTYEDIEEMSQMIEGSKLYCLQMFQENGDILNKEGSFSAYSKEEMSELKTLAEKYVTKVNIR